MDCERNLNYWKLFYFIPIIFSAIGNMIVRNRGDVECKIKFLKYETNIRWNKTTKFS